MKPYDPNAVCPKCDCSDIGTVFCVATYLNDYGDVHPHRGINDSSPGHLDRLCKNCRYKWVEEPMDAEEKERIKKGEEDAS